MNTKIWLITVFIVALIPNIASALEEAGKVIAVDGDLSAASGANKRTLSRKDSIFEGDTITSGAKASGQLRMQDGAIVELQPDTVFRIDHYHANPAGNGKDERSEMSLIKGGFKTLTGSIATRNPGSYQVNTANATMGVTGTYWGAAICAKTGIYATATDCPATAIEVGVWGPKLSKEEREAKKTCGAWIHSAKKEYNIGPCNEYSFARVLPNGNISGELSQSALFSKGTSGALISQATTIPAPTGGGTAASTPPVTPVLANNVNQITNAVPVVGVIGVVGTNSYLLGDTFSSITSNPPTIAGFTPPAADFVSSAYDDASPSNELFGVNSGTYISNGYEWLVANPATNLPLAGSFAGGILNLWPGTNFAFDATGNFFVLNNVAPGQSYMNINLNTTSNNVNGQISAFSGVNSVAWTIEFGGSWNGVSKNLSLAVNTGTSSVTCTTGCTSGLLSAASSVSGTFVDTQHSGLQSDIGVLVGFHGVSASSPAVTITGGAIFAQGMPGGV